LVQQKQDFSCGVAATLVLMRYWCVDAYENATESDLYEPLKTTRANGTEPEPMVELFRRSGVHADYRSGNVRVEDLERAVDAGEPPVVDLQAWSDHGAPWRQTWDAGHYVVMVGYDDDRLYFADPSRATPNGYAFLQRGELDDRWHDLSGEHDARLEHMAIFVRGTKRWAPTSMDLPHATRLG
jgi:predicted double-glycine peptidase